MNQDENLILDKFYFISSMPDIYLPNRNIAHKLLLALAFTCCFATVQAKKGNYSFVILLKNADLIVTGHITNVIGDSCYIFAIDRTIKGESSKQILVKMFLDWSCDMRWQKAEAGQKLFLCLEKSGNSYRSMGGSDGEIFIVGDKLRLFNVFNSKTTQYFNQFNSPRLGDVLLDIERFFSCYTFSKDKRLFYTFQPVRSENEIAAYKKTNKFSEMLFTEVAMYIMPKTVNKQV